MQDHLTVLIFQDPYQTFSNKTCLHWCNEIKVYIKTPYYIITEKMMLPGLQITLEASISSNG